jgi:hypothetical protein
VNPNNELALTWDRKANCFDPSKVQTVLLHCRRKRRQAPIRKLLGGTIETKIRSEAPSHFTHLKCHSSYLCLV